MNAVVKCWTDLRGVNEKNGAGKRNRTSDLLITNQLLYRLSYSSVFGNLYLLIYWFGKHVTEN